MNEYHELIRSMVLKELQQKAPLKATELYCTVTENFYKKFSKTHVSLTAEDISITLEKLVKSGEIKELEYALPGPTPRRVKSLYFPSGTELEIVK